MMDFGIAGKTALVCASSQGLGKAVAESLAREGVRLFLCGRDMDALRKTATEISAYAAHPVQFRTADLTVAAEREVLAAAVQSAFGGGLDILVHNTGGPPPMAAHAATADDWQEAFGRLFQSVTQLNSVFLPGMRARGWGRIVSITSLAAIEPVPDLALSTAMRAALTAYTKSLSDEVAAEGVTVNTVAPGFIATDRVDHIFVAQAAKTGQDAATARRAMEASIPVGRLGTPEELADVITFLCSARASFITGSALSVDGGKRRSVH